MNTERRNRRAAERDLMDRRDLAERLVRQIVARERWASVYQYDLVAHGLDQLEKVREVGGVDSDEAFLRRVMGRRMLDFARMQNVRRDHFDRLTKKVKWVKKPGMADNQAIDIAEYSHPQGGLSLQFIATEEEAMLALQASAAAACLPDIADQQLLRDKFFHHGL